MAEINRQVRLDASPSDVAAALATSPWRSAMRIEPAGAGSRVVISAAADPEELARAVENMALDEVCRLRSALADPAPRAAPLGTSSWARTVRTIEMRVDVDAPTPAVWTALADVGNVETWNPGISSARLTSPERRGVGVTRECVLSPMGTVQERITAWTDERLMTVEMYERKRLPAIRRALATIELTPDGARTAVGCHMMYEVGLGPIGRGLNAAMLHRMFRRSLLGMLAGLKHHVETGEAVLDATVLPFAEVRAA
ncbi:MAG: SRPBCC family protein [Actinomycetota bacterium]